MAGFYAKLQESDAVTDGMLKELRALLKEKKVSADDVTGIFAAPPRDATEAPKRSSSNPVTSKSSGALRS